MPPHGSEKNRTCQSELWGVWKCFVDILQNFFLDKNENLPIKKKKWQLQFAERNNAAANEKNYGKDLWSKQGLPHQVEAQQQLWILDNALCGAIMILNCQFNSEAKLHQTNFVQYGRP